MFNLLRKIFAATLTEFV